MITQEDLERLYVVMVSISLLMQMLSNTRATPIHWTINDLPYGIPLYLLTIPETSKVSEWRNVKAGNFYGVSEYI